VAELTTEIADREDSVMKGLMLASSIFAVAAASHWCAAATETAKASKILSALGINLRVTQPFDDQAHRQECGYRPGGRHLSYFLLDELRLSGHINDRGTSLTNFAVSKGGQLASCWDELQFSDLRFEEDALVGGFMNVVIRYQGNIQYKFQFDFNYDWRKIQTNIEINGVVVDLGRNKELFQMSSSTGIGGIDMIDIQEENTNKAGIPIIFTANLRGMRLSFHDSGLFDLVLGSRLITSS